MKQVSFKTLAEFKREARVGRFLRGGFYNKYSDEWREIIKVQSNAVVLKTPSATGGRSWFTFPKAVDVKIEDGVLNVFERRVRYGNTDCRADNSTFKSALKYEGLRESDCEFYETQVAEYVLGEE